VFSGTTGPCRKLNGFFTCNVQDEHNAIILDVTIQSPEGTQEQVPAVHGTTHRHACKAAIRSNRCKLY